MLRGEFTALLERLDACNAEQKRMVYDTIRSSITLHPIEDELGLKGEVILEAIYRAPDLTQRCIKGLLAETTFVMDVLPVVPGWRGEASGGELPHDAVARSANASVRIQVKLQRSESGQPMQRNGNFVVEVQRTRSGVREGIETRPYRVTEFDLLAVCMRPSTGAWGSFMYASSANLSRSRKDWTALRTLQDVPAHPSDLIRPKAISHDDFIDFEPNVIWTSDLSVALEECREHAASNLVTS